MSVPAPERPATARLLLIATLVVTSGMVWCAAAVGQSVTIAGPSSGAVGELLTFEATASDCVPIAAGWIWFSDGGQVAGTANTATLQVAWPNAGLKTLTASNLGCGAANGEFPVTISDSGRLLLTAAATQVSEGAGSVTLAARREGGTSGAVTVNYFTTGQSASAGEDFVAVQGELTWADGEAGDRLFTIGLIDDQLFEDDETFLVTLDQPTGGAQLGAVAETEVTLLEDDPPPGDLLSFSAPRYDAGEADDTVTVVVQRSSTLAGPLTVDFSTSDFTATAGTDYLPSSVTLQWAADDSSDRTIEIALIDDALVEGEETVDLELSNPSSGGFLGDPSFAELVLADDDLGTGAGTLRFSQATLTISEGDVPVDVEIQRTGGASGEVSVQISVLGGSATAGVDFELSPSSLSWPDGDSSPRSALLQPLQDTLQEGDETVQLALASPSGGVNLGTPDELTITLKDDEEVGSVSFVGSPPSVPESQASLTLLVGRAGDLSAPASARVRSRDLTARAGLDFEAVDQLLAWTAGDGGTRTVQVVLLDDETVEGDERFQLELVEFDGVVPGAVPAIDVTLRDDDVVLGTVGFATAGPLLLTEGAGAFDVLIERSGPFDLEASVRVRTIAGTADVDADFEPIDQILTWPAGDSTTRSVQLQAVDDQEAEGSETLQLVLLEPVNVTLATTVLAVQLDDDDAGTGGAISLSSEVYSASEGDGTLIVEVSRSGGSAGPASTLLQLLPGSAERPTDFVDPASLQIDWSDGSAGTRTLAVPLVDDDFVEPTETFQVRLALVSGADLGSVRVANASIIDDDSEQTCGPLDGAAEAGPDTLCINQDRFAVDVAWRSSAGDSGTARPVRLTDDTGYFWIFDDDNVELVIKVLDGCAINQRFWVFATGLTDVEIDLTVTDRLTGATRQVLSPLGEPFRPVLDTDAFALCPGTAQTHDPTAGDGRRQLWHLESSSVSASCAADRPAGTLCLRDARFEADLQWNDGQGNGGSAQPTELTADTGTFWIFDPDNIELVVKVLDGCAINGHYWVFAGGLTDLEATLRLTDRNAAASREYANTLGVPFEPILDVEAFAACP